MEWQTVTKSNTTPSHSPEWHSSIYTLPPKLPRTSPNSAALGGLSNQVKSQWGVLQRDIFLLFLDLLCMCTHLYVCTVYITAHVWRSDDTLWENWFCPSTFTRVPGIQLGPSGLAASTWTNWAILLVVNHISHSYVLAPYAFSIFSFGSALVGPMKA